VKGNAHFARETIIITGARSGFVAADKKLDGAWRINMMLLHFDRSGW